ncbi:MAG: hypothetical protein MMC33_009311 [Icmadophila ericetorum]|nr:hypothetical protein [Icmadophila ericetorum]
MEEKLPYWLANVPKEEWPSSCPDFLINANVKDRKILSTPDSEYHRLTWPELQHIIKTNRIDLLQRVPSDLRKYIEFNAKLRKEYGSVMSYILKVRLGWDDLTPQNSTPFASPADIKIVCNDWPYGIEQDIHHLIVWTKFDIEEDPLDGDLTPRGRKMIQDFVDETFCKRVPPDHVAWFKNWKSLKSIQSVEHFHVVLKEPDPDFLNEITNGDIPMSKRLEQTEKMETNGQI